MPAGVLDEDEQTTNAPTRSDDVKEIGSRRDANHMEQGFKDPHHLKDGMVKRAYIEYPDALHQESQHQKDPFPSLDRGEDILDFCESTDDKDDR
jgi:hypothetical protein